MDLETLEAALVSGIECEPVPVGRMESDELRVWCGADDVGSVNDR